MVHGIKVKSNNGQHNLKWLKKRLCNTTLLIVTAGQLQRSQMTL